MTGNEPPETEARKRLLPAGLAVAVLLPLAAAAALFLFMWGSPARAQSQDPYDDAWCLSCHGSPGMQVTLPSGETLDISVDPAVVASSVHGPRDIACANCHTDKTEVPHDPTTAADRRDYTLQANATCAGCHPDESTLTADGQHAAARAAGNRAAAVCTDCHGAHDATRPVAHSPEVPADCGKCHTEIYDLYRDSVHGGALVDGNREVPTCTDCHGVHALQGPTEHRFRLFSPQVCARCHADETLMSKYGISTRVFETYVSDFHGSTVVLFERLAPDQETNKPVCIDCHGVHAIRPPDDPASTVFQTNLLRTCQRCHPTATEDFPSSWLSHYSPEPGKATVVYIVQIFYRILVPVVIGGMALYVLIHRVRLSVSRRKARASA